MLYRNQRFKHRTSLARQRAVTIMELVAGIAITTILTVGAMTLYDIASMNSQSSQMIRNVVAVQSTTRSVWTGKSGYGTDPINPVLINLNSVPGDWHVSGVNIIHQFQGDVHIKGETASFTVTLEKLPQSVCAKVLGSLTSNWASAKVGTSPEITDLPVAPHVAAGKDYCMQSDAVTVVLTSR